MIPRNVFRHRIFVLCLAIIALGYIVPAQNPTKGYCSSEQDKPVVYFSSIFDVNIPNASHTISTQPLVNAFLIHLKEVYDYKTNSNYPVGCPLYKTLVEAEANKQKLKAQAQGLGKQIIEVAWTPPAWGQVLHSADPNFMPQAPPIPGHTFCAVGYKDTMYFSSVFDTVGPYKNEAWSDGFSEFLSKRYGFVAEVEATCTILNTVREAEYNLKARVGGVRANSHKAVETGWKYDPTGTYKPAPKPTPKIDDDPEPVQRPAPPPSKQEQDAAFKEMPISLAYCHKDPVLSTVFICETFSRSVHNYRVTHPGDTQSIATLVATEKLSLAECIDNIKVGLWIRDQATEQKFGTRVVNCITQKVIVTLYDKPQANHLRDFYNEAVRACNK